MTGQDALTPNGVATARSLAAALPDLLIEARRVAATVAAGWHGRRRAGPGEDFWQFRPFLSGEPMRGIDWRRSARDETLYVREREHENAHTVWLWADLSASMDFRSELANTSKANLALVLALAVAELLARAGERVGLVGDAEPTSRRDGAEVIAMKLARLGAVEAHHAPAIMRRRDDILLVSDFLGPQAERDALFADLATLESRVHLVEIADPIEETFPFTGRVDFVDPENGARLTAGRAEAWRETYLASRAEHRAHLVAACRPGWSHMLVRTDRPATETLIALCGQLSAPEGGSA
ncbi:DUF58 domain-containing protein [Pleomorphomonas diazotrophica]|uniref:DUF58 domain-containing protein n=1 Tax=Pleomorphomonas diazotrophica TaxID=1166257 RepID=A0A1I4WNZ7_9HYPH|nr:DUF58 domain-containing protein [Pleomorphomonas diazotrophica]PKR87301.1 DUF58 domain-containing protein [Pleomorphomonas diazotrophica]SFN15584.1 Protein of unknown function DUF58 [Pleomorphomonas diazotrophica]